MTVAVVTDSSACLPADAAPSVEVVPLIVVINGVEGLEGVDVGPAQVAAAFGARRFLVSTSRPSPAQFSAVYARLLSSGFAGVVSVHLSAALSGTVDAAASAAADVAGRVEVVDARSTGMGLGFPVLAAAAAAADGASVDAVRAAALDAVARTSTFFYVDTLEFLRRGGRINAAAALLGTALSVKPILHVAAGEVVLRDRVRTASRALARLVDLAVGAAGDAAVDVAVHHLDAPARAAWLSTALEERLRGRLRDRWVTEIGAAVAAHVGPGLASVVVHRRS
jgi:fatty acid kinase fatty acid binding subunit